MLQADLVLVNGNVITMRPDRKTAQAVAIAQGKLVAVGSNEQILSHVNEKTQKIDLEEKTVLPGFIDTHVHGAALGRSFRRIDLRNAKSIREIQQKVHERARSMPEGEWIIGRGWSQDQLTERRYPLHSDLDQAADLHPVFLLRVCGHLGVVNTMAMKLAGINEELEPPEGGRIDKDLNSGHPNGILRENALDLIYRVLPEPNENDLKEACLAACQRMVEEGITTVHWIIGSPRELAILKKLEDNNLLPLRIYALIPIQNLDNIIELGLPTGFGNERIRIGSLKILMDGSLGARTAALKRPYRDSAENKGMLLYSNEQLEAMVERAHKAGLQLAIHTIGDRAIEIALQILEKTLSRTAKRNHRHRLEHVSVPNPTLIEKMKEMNIIASVQPHFIISDFWIADRLGAPRARWAYPLKSLMNQRILTMGGSDAPIEPVSPILGIYAATSRRTTPEERLTIDEALHLYTVNAAYGSFEESVKGTIEKGKFADLVVLSQDPRKTAPQQVKGIKVEMTIVGGNIVHARKP